MNVKHLDQRSEYKSSEILTFEVLYWTLESLYVLPLHHTHMSSFTWSGWAPSLQAEKPFWEAENALRGVGEEPTVPPAW